MPTPIARIRSSIAKSIPFFEWWILELRQTFRPVLRHFETTRSVVELEIGDDCVQIRNRDAGDGLARCTTVASSFLDLDDDRLAELRSIVADAVIEICLPAKEVCLLTLRQVGLAAPTQESMKYRLLQESPIDVDRIVFTWRSIPAAQLGEVGAPFLEIAICRHVYLERVLGAARKYGLQPSVVGFRSSEGDKLEFVFPMGRFRGAGLSIKSHLNGILMASVLAMPVLAMIAIGAAANIGLRAAQRELDAQRSRLQESEALMRSQAELNGIHSALRQIAVTPSAVNALNELGRLVPPDTWMTEIRVEGRSLHLTGLSSDPAGAAKAIAPSKLLTDIRLRSVSTPNSDKAVSQFEITAMIAGTP